MDELKPCPFCGSTDVHITDAWPHYVYCLGCNARVKPINPQFGEDGIKEAVMAWNRRRPVKEDT